MAAGDYLPPAALARPTTVENAKVTREIISTVFPPGMQENARKHSVPTPASRNRSGNFSIAATNMMPVMAQITTVSQNTPVMEIRDSSWGCSPGPAAAPPKGATLREATTPRPKPRAGAITPGRRYPTTTMTFW